MSIILDSQLAQLTLRIIAPMDISEEQLSPCISSRQFCRNPSWLKEIPPRTHPDFNQKSLIEELEKIIIESDEEIKRLNHSLIKLKQLQTNKEIYYQAKLAKLQQQNEEYTKRLDELEGNKRSRVLSVRQNRQHKLMFNSSCHPSIAQDKENINTLNTYNQPCQNPECSQYLQLVRQQTQQIIHCLDDLLASIAIHSPTFERQEWYQEFQAQKARRRKDGSHSAHFLLKKVQKKIEELEMSLDEENENKKIGGAYVEVLKGINTKKTSLGKIPFLQKINLQSRAQEYKDIVRDSHRSQRRILQMIRKL